MKTSLSGLASFWKAIQVNTSIFWIEFTTRAISFFFVAMLGIFLSLAFYYLPDRESRGQETDFWSISVFMTLFCIMFAFVHWYMLKKKRWDNPVTLFYPTIFTSIIMFFITSFSLFSLLWAALLALTVHHDIKEEKERMKKELEDLIEENDYEAKGYEI